MSEISRTRPTSSLEDWENSPSGEYPNAGQGLNSGFTVRELIDMLRAQKARSGQGKSALTSRHLPLTSAGNVSGFASIRLKRK